MNVLNPYGTGASQNYLKNSLNKKQLLDDLDSQGESLAKSVGVIAGATLSQDNSVINKGIGGALTGLATFGSPLGALLGLGSGLISGATAQSRKQTQNRKAYEQMFVDKAAPSYYAKQGGIIMPVGEEGAVKTQSQRGEVIALPTGGIVDVHSKKTHKQMKKEVTTDYIPVGSWVGDESNKIKLKDAEKVTLGFNPGMYREHDKDKKGFEEIKLSDALGKKKEITAAEGLKSIRDYIPIPEDLDKDVYNPFAMETAKENYITRDKFVKGLMGLAAKKNQLLYDQLQSL